jgi:hypothetical protein
VVDNSGGENRDGFEEREVDVDPHVAALELGDLRAVCNAIGQ